MKGAFKTFRSHNAIHPLKKCCAQFIWSIWRSFYRFCELYICTSCRDFIKIQNVMVCFRPYFLSTFLNLLTPQIHVQSSVTTATAGTTTITLTIRLLQQATTAKTTVIHNKNNNKHCQTATKILTFILGDMNWFIQYNNILFHFSE